MCVQHLDRQYYNDCLSACCHLACGPQALNSEYESRMAAKLGLKSYDRAINMELLKLMWVLPGAIVEEFVAVALLLLFAQHERAMPPHSLLLCMLASMGLKVGSGRAGKGELGDLYGHGSLMGHL